MQKRKYTPKRLSSLSNEDRLIAIGDVHGCYESLKALLEGQINITTNDQIFLLGDFINKGPKSKDVLEYIQALQKDNYTIIPLRGNHEESLLMAYECGFDFFENYLYQYNSLDLLDGNIEDYLAFCAQLEYAIELDQHVLSHLGFSQHNESLFTDARKFFPLIEWSLHPEFFQKQQIHGHIARTPQNIQQAILENAPKLSIDSGCVYKETEGLGQLCALDLLSNELYFQANIEKLEEEEL